MITRTDTTATVTVKCFNLDSMEVVSKQMNLPRATANDSEKCIKEAKKLYDGTNGFQALIIESVDIPACMTGAHESDFSIIAMELDDKRRPIHEHDSSDYARIGWQFLAKSGLAEKELLDIIKSLFDK